MLLLLEVKCELENLASLKPKPDTPWVFSIKCGSCQERSDKESHMVQGETYDIPNSRGEANLVQKCKFCGRFGTINFVEEKGKTRASGEYAPFLLLECRGVEPVTWHPRDGYTAESAASATRFDDVDLSDGEFVDYDEKGKASVGVYNIQHRFRPTK
eukprot:jgi/Chlat1/1986/Chrsp158S02314